MGSEWDGQKKRPLSALFWYVRLTHQLFPSACHSRQHNEPVARLGSLKNHQQSNGPPGTARGSLIWTPVPTQWVVSLPPLSPAFSPSLSRGGWNMCNMVVGWCRWGHQSHTTMHVQMHHRTRFYTCTLTTLFLNDILTTRHVARWESKFITKREVAGKSSAESTRVLLSVSDTGKEKRGARGLFLTALCKCSLQPSCHSRSAKWITLKVREKCLVRLSNSSSPKPICLPVTAALGD